MRNVWQIKINSCLYCDGLQYTTKNLHTSWFYPANHSFITTETTFSFGEGQLGKVPQAFKDKLLPKKAFVEVELTQSSSNFEAWISIN